MTDCFKTQHYLDEQSRMTKRPATVMATATVMAMAMATAAVMATAMAMTTDKTKS